MEATTLENSDAKVVPRRLLRRDQLDGRTSEAKFLHRLAADLERDLGGRDALTAVERSLIEAFCGTRALVDHLNARLARGEAVDASEHSQVASTLLRLASRLGLPRRIVTTEGD
jgi:hypothetical protein